MTSHRFPLYSKGVDTYRFEYAVYLLNKDIESVSYTLLVQRFLKKNLLVDVDTRAAVDRYSTYFTQLEELPPYRLEWLRLGSAVSAENELLLKF
jgi:hypothetical protein